MIRKLKDKVLFRVTPPLEFNFEFNSVRLTEDMPDFKAVMLIDKFGRCSTNGPVLKLEQAELQSWSLTKSLDGAPSLYFQIAGRTFHVTEVDVLEVFNYFLSNLPNLWKDVSTNQ